MKTIVKTLLLILFAFSLPALAQSPMSNKPWHKSLSGQCISCHEQEKPAAASGTFKCTTCHGSPQDMAQKTAGRGIQNPHTSIHFETALPCEECHKEHREPYNYCTESCHRTWPNNIPGKP